MNNSAKKQSKGEAIVAFMKPSVEGYSRKVSVKDLEKVGLSEAGNGWPTLRNSGYVNRMYVLYKTHKGGKLVSIELHGTRTDTKSAVYVPKEIKDWHNTNTRELGCARCGSHHRLQLDHCVPPERKVIEVENLTTSDFQWLCTHCNDQKREVCNICIKTGRRGSAPRGFSVPYFQGGEKWSAPLGCKGCVHHNYVAFRSSFVQISLEVRP